MAMARVSGSTTPVTPHTRKDQPVPPMEGIARQLALQVSEQLPAILKSLQEGGFDPENQPLQLECSLTAGNGIRTDHRVPVAALSIGRDFTPFSSAVTTPQSSGNVLHHGFPRSVPVTDDPTSPTPWSWRTGDVRMSAENSDSRPSKRRKDGTVSLRPSAETAVGTENSQSQSSSLIKHDVQRKKRVSDNPALAPSTFDKFVGGVWESIYSGLRMDPAEVIEQWQAIESGGQPKLLTDNEHHVAIRDNTSAFGRINVLARKISQTSRTCRSLEVIVQVCFVGHITQ